MHKLGAGSLTSPQMQPSSTTSAVGEHTALPTISGSMSNVHHPKPSYESAHDVRLSGTNLQQPPGAAASLTGQEHSQFGHVLLTQASEQSYSHGGDDEFEALKSRVRLVDCPVALTTTSLGSVHL